MGDPVAWQYADRDSFAHLFCSWYVDHRPDCAWVVDDGDGRAAGYLIGTPDGGRSVGDGGPDGARHTREFALRHVLGRGLLLRRGTRPFILRAARDLRRDSSALRVPVDRRAYPADLHINLLPAVRGRGLGAVLVRTWFERLAADGVPGVHLGTFGENTGAIAFFESMGFTWIGDRALNPGFRTRDGGRNTVRHFVRPIP